MKNHGELKMSKEKSTRKSAVKKIEKISGVPAKKVMVGGAKRLEEVVSLAMSFLHLVQS